MVIISGVPIFRIFTVTQFYTTLARNVKVRTEQVSNSDEGGIK